MNPGQSRADALRQAAARELQRRQAGLHVEPAPGGVVVVYKGQVYYRVAGINYDDF